MNSASQPDSTYEWSKFAPLPPRLRRDALSPTTEPRLDTPPDSADAESSSKAPNDSTIEIQTLPAANPPRGEMVAPPAEEFTCQNRKCLARREKHGHLARPLYSAQWREMKIGKHHRFVLDLKMTCPDCGFEHVHTLIPPDASSEEISRNVEIPEMVRS